MRPVPLAPNTLRSFYRGDGRIAAFRDDPTVDAADAEDWIASTTSRSGAPGVGATTLPDGIALTAAVAGDGEGWLGARHLATHGAVGTMLVKLLDAGQRLPLHVHPTRAFARDHLGSAFGKSEAWLVLAAEDGASARLGFARDVAAPELREWVERQDTATMLDACHEVPLRAGDVVYCPGGLPHAIGSGVLILEIQEASDLSIMLEWDGFPLDPADSFLGVPPDLALSAVERRGLSPADLADLRGRCIVHRSDLAGGVRPLLPEAARDLFAAEQVGGGVELAPSFAVLVVTDGTGTLHSDTGDLPLTRGGVALVPHAAGRTRIEGDVSVVRLCPR